LTLARIPLALAATALLVTDDGPASARPGSGGLLADEAREILRADYRGDRGELVLRARALASSPVEPAALARYWAGFAWWRRGMNGFSETPRPEDVGSDFERGAAEEREALRLDPSLDEARAALAGCLVGMAFARPEGEGRTALLGESTAILSSLEPRAEGNPRILWMLGGRLMAPPGQGGDLARAAETFRRGLLAARREALGPARAPALPGWGAPENLMSLALVHAIGPAADRDVARAYADGALAMVPDWRFVRDVLVPRIEALPAAARRN